MPGFVSSPLPPFRPTFPALCVAGRPIQVSLILARWYAIPCGLCVPLARSGCPSGPPRVCFVCACARALAAFAPNPPPWVGVARAPGAVLVMGAGRAVPHGSCPSACPASVPCAVWLAWWGGAARSRSPLAWLGVVCPPSGEPLGRAAEAVSAGGAGVWTRHQPHSAALASWLYALWGRLKGTHGGSSCFCVGGPGSGALPPPTARPLGRAAGAHHPLAVGAGGAGEGTRHQTHSAGSCELALRAVKAAQGRQGGAPLAWVCGVRGWALSRPRPPVLWGVQPGPTTHWLWVRGLRVWGPV